MGERAMQDRFSRLPKLELADKDSRSQHSQSSLNKMPTTATAQQRSLTNSPPTPRQVITVTSNLITEDSIRRIFREELATALLKYERPSEAATPSLWPRIAADALAEPADEAIVGTDNHMIPNKESSPQDEEDARAANCSLVDGFANQNSFMRKREVRGSVSFDTAKTKTHLEMEHSAFLQRVYRRFAKPIDAFLNLKEPERTGTAASIIKSPYFEATILLLIASNLVFSYFGTNAQASQPLEDTSVRAVESAFLFVFTVELILKLIVHKAFFVIGPSWGWNLFDTFLVVFGILDLVDIGGDNVVLFRTIRCLRIARPLRMLRLVRLVPDLQLILSTIIGSLQSLAWSIVMMLLIAVMFATFFVQSYSGFVVHSAETDSSSSAAEEFRSFFGSMETAIFSLFVVTTGGDWTEQYRVLGYVGEFPQFVYLFFIAFTNIAFLNILTALFIENALKLAMPDREAMAFDHRINQFQEVQELTELCNKHFGDGDDCIDANLFERGIKSNPRLQAHFEVIGLDCVGLKLFFQRLAKEHAGENVPIELFVEGCMKLKNSASSMNIHEISLQTAFGFEYIANKIQALEDRILMNGSGRRVSARRPPSSDCNANAGKDERSLQLKSGAAFTL